LLELIDALLTTTGCGRPLQRPQPIDLRVLAVNEFMTIFRPKFLSFWLAHHPPATLAVKIQTSPQIRVKKIRFWAMRSAQLMRIYFVGP
jgi:hypothetical protein